MVETVPNVGQSLMVVFDAENVLDAIELLKLLGDLQREAELLRKTK
jgi:hypothetical protein